MDKADTMQTAMMAHLARAQTSHEAFTVLSQVTGTLETLLQDMVNTPDPLPSDAIRQQTARRLFHTAAIAQRAIIDLHLPYVLPGEPASPHEPYPKLGNDRTHVPA